MKNKTRIKTFLLTAGLLWLGLFDPAAAQQTSLAGILQKAANAGIEESSLNELQSRAESRGMDEQQLANIIEPAVSLAEENLPADHLIQKVMEGLSKGVPGTRIVPLIHRMRNSTVEAAGMIDPWMKSENVQQMISRTGEAASDRQIRDHLIKVSSKAITQDISAGAVGQILTAVNEQSVLSRTNASNIVAAIGVLPDLDMANQPDVARSFIVRALRGGFSSSDFQKMPTALSMAQMRDQIPAASILEGVSNQLQGGTPAAQVLQNLFDGNPGGGPPGNIPRGLENRPGP